MIPVQPFQGCGVWRMCPTRGLPPTAIIIQALQACLDDYKCLINSVLRWGPVAGVATVTTAAAVAELVEAIEAVEASRRSSRG